MRAFLAALPLWVGALTAYVKKLPLARSEVASCYDRERGQTRTAMGAKYRPWAKVGAYFGAAHRTLPFGTLVLVCGARADAGKGPSTAVDALSQPVGAHADGGSRH
jgi:rare lipoprotein A (peptidoglycan hydrolase)